MWRFNVTCLTIYTLAKSAVFKKLKIMWYLIGMLLCVAYCIIMPFVRHKESWNNLLKTINIQKDLWHAIFGHFIISLIPLPADYEEYCDAVLNWDDSISFWGWVGILVAIILLWIITIPIGIIFLIFLFIKFGVEYYFETKITKNEPRGFKD